MKELPKPLAHCVGCGIEFRYHFDRQWAMLWDGSLWRMYQHIDPEMRWGPYCTACAGPEVQRRNRIGRLAMLET